MKKICFLLIAVLLFSSNSQARRNHEGRSEDGFDGFILTYSPLALAPLPSPKIRFGAEYCPTGRLAFGLDLAYIFHKASAKYTNNINNTGDGLGFYPDVRYYIGNGNPLRPYVGLQGFYRTESFGRGNFSVNYNTDVYNCTQSGATEEAYGIAAHGGFAVRGGDHFRFELGGVIGVKNVRYDRNNITKQNVGSSHIMFQTEDQVLYQETLPYISLDLKIGYRTAR